MITKALITLIMLISVLLYGQTEGSTAGQNNDTVSNATFSIGFAEERIESQRNREEDVKIPIVIKTSKLKETEWPGSYVFEVKVNTEETTLSTSEFKLIAHEKKFNLANDEEIFLLVIKSGATNESSIKQIVLELVSKDSATEIQQRNIADNKDVVVIVKPYHAPINDYTMLSFLGTNFNMVNGKTTAENLFFATNIFVPPHYDKNKKGFYLSLYGNRTMSDTDSTGNLRRTYKLEPLNDSIYIEHTSQNRRISTTVSDNIGAYISPLIKIHNSQHRIANFNLYYSPSLEFIWRKVTVSHEFKDPTNLSTIQLSGYLPGTIELDNVITTINNEYVFNLGIASAFLEYERDIVSVRVHASVGTSTSFYLGNISKSNREREHDIFFLGRAWITEPYTGITLQAEIMNTMKIPRPFFGVTLSKAFNLRELAGLFSPVNQ